MAELENDLSKAWTLYAEAKQNGLWHNLCLGVGLRAFGGDIDLNFLNERNTEGKTMGTAEVLEQAGMELGATTKLQFLDPNQFVSLVTDPEKDVDMIKGQEFRHGRPVTGMLGVIMKEDNQGHLLALRKMEPFSPVLPDGMVVVDTDSPYLMGLYSLAAIYDNLQRYRDNGYDVFLASVLKK